MASGGMDWFRWHHGSVNDPKFQLVARRVGCSTAEVIAVWACVLEAASQAEERGAHGALDFEALDCSLGLPDGRTQDIYLQMQQRGIVDGETVVSWHKRQPKREDETANERKRRQREHERELERLRQHAGVTCESSQKDTQNDVIERDKNECHAMSRNVTHGHARGEERREDISPPTPPCGAAVVDGEGDAAAPPADQKPKPPPEPPPQPPPGPVPDALRMAYAEAAKAMRSAGVSDAHPGHAKLQAFVRAGVPPDVFASAGAEAVARKKRFSYALTIVQSQLFEAAKVSDSGASFQPAAASAIPRGWI